MSDGSTGDIEAQDGWLRGADASGTSVRPASSSSGASRDIAPDERRAHPRVELEADVSLYSETNFWSGYTEDVSEGGLFVATWDRLPIGTKLEVRFELPTGRTFHVRGEVRWLREASECMRPGVGVRFETLAPDELVAIRAFVKHRAPMFWDDDEA